MRNSTHMNHQPTGGPYHTWLVATRTSPICKLSKNSAINSFPQFPSIDKNEIYHDSKKENPQSIKAVKFGCKKVMKYRNIVLHILYIFIYITREKAYHISAEISGKLLDFFTGNTRIY